MKKRISLLIALLWAPFAVRADGPSPDGTAGPAFKNGQFKIVQFTDIHYVVGNEDSRGAMERMKLVLDIEKPDIVVFTGDIVVSKQETRKGWDEVLEEVVRRGIPWAYVPGNHDDETEMTRAQIIDYVSAKPHSLTRRGPLYVGGACNYTVEVRGADGSTAAVLYCMDSNAYSTVEGLKGYGWFGFDQVEWYRNTSAAYTRENGGKPLPALAFFHIPLCEYGQLTALGPEAFTGTNNEKECPGAINTGMYAAMLTAGDVMCTFVGHDHNNDYIGFLNGPGLAYGRFSGSKTTYTDIGYGARAITLSEGERGFETWIRDGAGEKLHAVKRSF